MNVLLEFAVANAINVTLLGLLVYAVTRFPCRPVIKHGLWLIVLLKFLTPPLVRWDFPIELSSSFQETKTSSAATSATPIANTKAEVVSPTATPSEQVLQATTEIPFSLETAEPIVGIWEVIPPILVIPDESEVFWREPFPVSPVDEIPQESLPRSEATATTAPETVPQPFSHEDSPATVRIPWLHLLLGVWFAGSMFWFLSVGRSVWTLHRSLSRLSPATREQQSMLDNLARRMGLRHWPELRVTQATIPPLLSSLGGRSLIVLPGQLLATLSPAQQQSIITHELAHYQRGDHYCRLLEYVVLGLFWWHPVAWLARRELHDAEEQCCDGWVLNVFPDQATSYAQALLSTVDFLAEFRAPVALGTSRFVGPVLTLRRRLNMILKERRSPEIPVTTRVLMVLLAMGVFTNTLWVFAQEEPKPEPTPTAKVPPPPVPVEAPPATVVLEPSVKTESGEDKKPVDVNDPAGEEPQPKGIEVVPGKVDIFAPDVPAPRKTETRKPQTVEERLQRLEKLLEKLAGTQVAPLSMQTSPPPYPHVYVRPDPNGPVIAYPVPPQAVAPRYQPGFAPDQKVIEPNPTGVFQILPFQAGDGKNGGAGDDENLRANLMLKLQTRRAEIKKLESQLKEQQRVCEDLERWLSENSEKPVTKKEPFVPPMMDFPLGMTANENGIVVGIMVTDTSRDVIGLDAKTGKKVWVMSRAKSADKGPVTLKADGANVHLVTPDETLVIEGKTGQVILNMKGIIPETDPKKGSPIGISR